MDFKDMSPRYEAAMSILGKKWTGLILRSLMEGQGPHRFTEMSAYVPGLSDRLLSQRLQELEEAGIVERRVYSERPVLVEYSLTAQGQALREVVEAIQHWADGWGPNIGHGEPRHRARMVEKQ
ncbi:MAG: HxlR family transcriptional regulator [Dehalococcoidia bacterium]|nr:HxlR family transcriptional regulator [Dehalococcoidia bacterium]